MHFRTLALRAASTVVLALGAGCAPSSADSAVPEVCEDDIAACCKHMKAVCAFEHVAGSEAYDECVFGPDFDGSTGCIPWGPPVPPRASHLSRQPA